MKKTNSLLDRMLKISDSNFASLMHKSEVFNREDSFIETDIPMLNVALSSNVDKGLQAGILMIAGESKRFKSLFGLYLMAAFQKKHPDGVCIFYDTEFGTPKKYIEKSGLDWKKIIHIPITKIEELKHEVAMQLSELKKENNLDNKVFMLVDSIGNIASSKEIEDAKAGNEKADMTRAKQLKSLFRIITVDLNLLDIPFVCVNHTYKSQSFIPMDIVGGGQSAMLNPDNVWIIKRKKEKDGDENVGFKFTIDVEKSRLVKEKSKIPIIVHWEDGIHKYSGLSDVAIDLGIVESIKLEDVKRKPKGLKFKDKTVLLKEEDNDSDFWEYVLKESDLKKLIHEKYTI